MNRDPMWDPSQAAPEPNVRFPRWRALLGPGAWLLVGWLFAGVLTGVRLHLAGGVFGEAVPLGVSIAGSLMNALPWVGAAAAAWVMARLYPLTRGELIPGLTLHMAAGFVVVVVQQVAQAGVRAWMLPAELAPPDPWAQLPLDLARWGPVGLVVYGVLVAVMLGMHHPRAG